MKKIFKKMYKILMALGILLINIKNKVLALTPDYGVDNTPATAYGLDYMPAKRIKIAIPIFWIIGIIVYWKKSKKEKKEKIKVLVIVNAIIIVLILMGIIKIVSLIAIPIFWIIGIIVYWNKSEEEKKEKIKVLVMVSAIIFILLLIGIPAFMIIFFG